MTTKSSGGKCVYDDTNDALVMESRDQILQRLTSRNLKKAAIANR